MNIELLGQSFKVLDTIDKITIADSFVVPQNKIGTANGEAKLYVGHDKEDIREFFGDKGFKIRCFLLKSDILNYLVETEAEYLKPEQKYRRLESLPDLWKERKNNVERQPEGLEFEANEQTQITGPRLYIKSSDEAYQLIRELSLPNITYISVVKLLTINGELKYYFRLFTKYFGDVEHPYTIQKEVEKIENIKDEVERDILSRARIGQGKYREELLKLCPHCPITMISDKRLLIASHIKPWAKSDNTEKIDPYNGFMFTPTFDLLFDRGFMSFTNDKKIILSPFLSEMTYSKIGISRGQTFDSLPIEGREKYLDYHRSKILNFGYHQSHHYQS